MDTSPIADRRKHVRVAVSTGAQFHHAPTGRDFPGRCIDVSQGGLLMYVPAQAPLMPGQRLRILLDHMDKEEFSHLSGQSVDAEVVRVDRHKLLSMGHLAVGVKFVGVA